MPIEFGVREVKARVMQGVAQEWVANLLTEEAIEVLIASGRQPETVTSEELDEAMRSARVHVAQALRPDSADTAEQQKYKELIARSLAGYGDRVGVDWETNMGDGDLEALKTVMAGVLKGIPP